jgi:hypothetical protein
LGRERRQAAERQKQQRAAKAAAEANRLAAEKSLSDNEAKELGWATGDDGGGGPDERDDESIKVPTKARPMSTCGVLSPPKKPFAFLAASFIWLRSLMIEMCLIETASFNRTCSKVSLMCGHRRWSKKTMDHFSRGQLCNPRKLQLLKSNGKTNGRA